MTGTKEIKRRIKSVKNTKKITKAMEMVAASKMKRAVSQTLSSRLYAEYSWELLTSVAHRIDEIAHPFFEQKKPKENKTGQKNNTLIVLVSSNRGLCGSYNTQVVQKTLTKIKELSGESNIEIVSVGKKGDSAMRHVGQEVILSFTEMPDIVGLRDISSLSQFITEKYKSGKYTEVYIAYTDFVSALSQKAQIKKLLPIQKEELSKIQKESKGSTNSQKDYARYSFEGDMNSLIEVLAEKLVRMQIYQMVLESSASEQSARMIAMKNASDAAGEMIDDLTLVFNKARQASITQEISEISAGMASLN